MSHLTEFERRIGPRETLKETILSARVEAKKRFQGDCWNCHRKGHRSSECRSKSRPVESPSTGPLAPPRGRRGLSPPLRQPNQQARQATKVSWVATTKPENPREKLLWIVDSGYSRHMTYSKEAFTEYRVLDTPIQISTATGARIQAIAEGTVAIQVAVKGAVRTIELTEVLYMPRIAGSLISVLQL